MPFFLVENTAQNATWFWIISRLTLSIGLLLIFFFKDKMISKNKRVLFFFLSFIYTAIVGFIVLFLPDKLPLLIIEGKGLTPLKIGFEYFISIIFLCIILLLILKYRKDRNYTFLVLITAIGFMLLSELVFTLYKHVYDFENLIGHFFKVVSYYFLLKGVYSQTIEEPYLKQKEMQKALSENMKELMHAQEKINYLAYHDELTGLPNRYYYKDQCSLRMNENIAVLWINLNRFKNVNDSLGNDIGDAFLQTVASRLKEFTKKEGRIAARLGGDEFGLLIEEGYTAQSIISFAKDISKRLQEPMKAKGFTFHIDASIGITINSRDVKDEDQLFQQANIALHEAKSNSQAYMIFHPDMNEERVENIILENELRQAIEQNNLTLFYQPQLNTQSGKLIGVEALIRWMHPKKGMISPGRFIPLAEESGLIVPIGKWVLNEACKQMKIWQDSGLKNIRISVNLSLRQFFQDDLVDTVANALEQSGLEPQYLELEITESLAMNVERAIALLNSLKLLGVRIAIDDFGTGYSSFSYLHQLPIDQLKIDQSFIQNLSIDTNNEAIVETIITMGHHLRLDLIAEGVETEEQLKFLHRNQCNGIQGYLISRPLPASDIEPILWEKNSLEAMNK